MKYRAIIHDSWVLTQENKKLIWWFAFLPALLTSLVAMVYLAYQAVAFWTSPYFHEQSEGTSEIFTIIFGSTKSFMQDQPTVAVVLIVIASIVALGWLMLPVFTQGALIQLVARIRIGHKVTVLEGISFGFTRFLQLFEYHLLVKTFSFISIFTEAAFVLRNLGPKSFAVFGWIFLLVLVVGLVLTLLFTYSEYYIVLDRKGVFKSILASSGLVVRQWHHTLFMLLLMVIISVRIIFNIIVALLVPILVIAPIFFFASITLATIGVIIGAIVGLIALYFASYFLGIFHVFATAVWTFTFLELTKHKEEEDSIDFRQELSGLKTLEDMEEEEVSDSES